MKKLIVVPRDPIGGQSRRSQIIKGWLDRNDKTHEKVYNVVWSGSRQPDGNGRLPPIGNKVDIENANWTNTIGASELGVVWTDRDFGPNDRAFYYARVSEIPTPRWIVYDAFRYGTEIPKDAVTIHQERAYTWPIWHTP